MNNYKIKQHYCKLVKVTWLLTEKLQNDIHGISYTFIASILNITRHTFAVKFFEVFCGVVIAKLCYAASAWWGFASANDIG